MTNHRRGSHRWIRYLHCSHISARTFSLTLFVPWRRRKSEFKHSGHESVREIHKIEQDQQNSFPGPKSYRDVRETGPRKEKKCQIERGSMATIIHFLIRFAGARSLPWIRSLRSRCYITTFKDGNWRKEKKHFWRTPKMVQAFNERVLATIWRFCLSLQTL